MEVHCDPAPYSPRKIKKRTGLLLKEFEHRAGDPNVGGSTGKPIITAYRQDALRCLAHIAKNNEALLKDIKAETGVIRASSICQNDYYGWFIRISRGCYGLSPKGEQALIEYGDQLEKLK